MGLTFSRDGKTAETGTMNLTNLLPENIRQGVNIAGVVGTYTQKIKTMTIPIPNNQDRLLYVGNTMPIINLPKNVRIFSIIPQSPVNFIVGESREWTFKYDYYNSTKIGKINVILRLRNSLITKTLWRFDGGWISNYKNGLNEIRNKNYIKMLNFTDNLIYYRYGVEMNNQTEQSEHMDTMLSPSNDDHFMWEGEDPVLELCCYRSMNTDWPNELDLNSYYNDFMTSYNYLNYVIYKGNLEIKYLD